MNRSSESKIKTETKPVVSIIIPTFENEEIFTHCLRSILCFTKTPIEIVVVLNGGDYQVKSQSFQDSDIKWIVPGKNLGWMGGINAARSSVSGEYVLMLNDDAQILDFDNDWLNRLVESIKGNVVAAGPLSNAVMGNQNIGNSAGIGFKRHTTPAISGFCFLIKKSILDEMGWLDESLPGGDDLDLSLRLLKAGYELGICRDVFLFHRYAVTGRKVHGKYWDSQEHHDDINAGLIRKHGFLDWVRFETQRNIACAR